MSQHQSVTTEDECRVVLRAAFPGLAIESLGYLAEGWDSTVFEVNGTHVFRFPKRAGVDATLRKEIRLLPALVPVLPTPNTVIRIRRAAVRDLRMAYRWVSEAFRNLRG